MASAERQTIQRVQTRNWHAAKQREKKEQIKTTYKIHKLNRSACQDLSILPLYLRHLSLHLSLHLSPPSLIPTPTAAVYIKCVVYPAAKFLPREKSNIRYGAHVCAPPAGKKVTILWGRRGEETRDESLEEASCRDELLEGGLQGFSADSLVRDNEGPGQRGYEFTRQVRA